MFCCVLDFFWVCFYQSASEQLRVIAAAVRAVNGGTKWARCRAGPEFHGPGPGRAPYFRPVQAYSIDNIPGHAPLLPVFMSVISCCCSHLILVLLYQTFLFDFVTDIKGMLASKNKPKVEVNKWTLQHYCSGTFSNPEVPDINA